MKRTRFTDAPCSIARSLDVLGDWWTPLIIREALYGVTRFGHLQRWLGIGRNILSRRLEELVEKGILKKSLYEERPPRFEYVLTDKGYDAAKVVVAMMPFGEKWLFGTDGEPIRLYDRETGQRVRPLVVDAATGKALDPRSLVAGPGPSFPASDSVRKDRFPEYLRIQQEWVSR